MEEASVVIGCDYFIKIELFKSSRVLADLCYEISEFPPSYVTVVSLLTYNHDLVEMIFANPKKVCNKLASIDSDRSSAHTVHPPLALIGTIRTKQ